MIAIRRLFRDHAWIAAFIVAAAMLLRVVVPAGFMPTTGDDGRLTVMVCSGDGSRAMTIAIPGLGKTEKRGGEHEKPGAPCAFAGLSAPSLGGADPILLAAALVLATLAALTADTPVRSIAARRLRPPLRAPPTPSIA